MDGIRMNTECSLPDLFLPHRFIFPAPKENILNILFFRKYLQAVFFYSISLLSVILRSNFLFCDAFRGEKSINFIELSHSRYKTKTNKLSLFSVRIHCSVVSLRRKKKCPHLFRSCTYYILLCPVSTQISAVFVLA